MHTNDDIEICDESTDECKIFQLYVRGKPCGTVVKRNGVVELIWDVSGPQYWPLARLLMKGLLDLTMIADHLSEEK